MLNKRSTYSSEILRSANHDRRVSREPSQLKLNQKKLHSSKSTSGLTGLERRCSEEVEAEPDRPVACNNVSFLFDDDHRIVYQVSTCLER
jgi:hypothetical protein